MLISIVGGVFATRAIKSLIEYINEVIFCEYLQADIDLDLQGDTLSLVQYIVALLISFFFYITAFVLIFDKSASPVSILVTSADLFNREYDQEIEYLTYRLRGIEK